MPKMKAIKTFFGDEGSIRRGREFDARPGNVKSYVDRGLAMEIGGAKPKASASTNAAAAKGPLSSRGGATGAAKPQRSSRVARAPRGRASKGSAAKSN